MSSKMVLKHWEVSGYYPYMPYMGKDTEKFGASITGWIPAEVPGSVHHDLWRAGWIEDPYYGMNSLACEWVENRWWKYRTYFDFEPTNQKRHFLHFEGLDYKAHIYLNDTLLGSHEGAFIPITFEVTNQLMAKQNELIVMFENVPDEHGQGGHASHTQTQKSRFAYKWDFCARMVPIGIWDNVYIKSTGNTRITETWLKPELTDEKGILNSTISFQQPENVMDELLVCKIDLYRNKKLVATKTDTCQMKDESGSHKMELIVEQPEIWYPNGLGEQPLYEVVIQLWHGHELSDEWRGHTGFRDLTWIQNENAPSDALPYCLQVNGQRVYVKGVNLTPFDMLIGTVSTERYADFIKQIKDANINLVRINGVGLIEKEIFYQLCDQTGILVWQEFIQTSSTEDRVPPTNEVYLNLLAENSISALKAKRNHVSLACWSGGNELTDSPQVTASFANQNIAFLKNLVDKYDPGRYFIPTSATGPNEFLNIEEPGFNHDVHGPWNYGNSEGHYHLYNYSDSLFHGELGVEGMSSLESLKRFLPEQELIVKPVTDSPMWRHHGDWWDTYYRDTKVFGDISDLPSFIKISQFIQAEGMRYALEANRRRKYQNSGSMIWAYNEPFPNVTNTCLVDYYGAPKMSYYWVRQAYADLNLSLKYDRLFHQPGETFHGQVFIHNSLAARDVAWKVEVMDLDGNVLWKCQDTTWSLANRTTPLQAFSLNITEQTPEVFMVRLSFMDGNEADFSNLNAVHTNEYIFSTQGASKEDPIFKSLKFRKQPELKWERLTALEETNDGRTSCTYEIKNKGGTAALFVKAKVDSHEDFVYCPQNYQTLFPGETIRYEVSWKTQENNISTITFESF